MIQLRAKARLVFTDGLFDVYSLGGLYEVGRSCTAIRHNPSGKILLVDCGALFGEEEVSEESDISALGPRNLLPDLEWLADKLDQVVGVFVTHGHLDHILGLPRLYRLLAGKPDSQPLPPILTGRFTWELIKQIFAKQEQKLPPWIPLNQNKKEQAIGPFIIRPIQVVHSIPQTFSAVIGFEGRKETLLFVSDFKWQSSRGAKVITAAKVKRRLKEALVGQKLSCLMLEALYCDRPGLTRPELTVQEPFAQILQEHPHERKIVSFFASNVERLEALLEIARGQGLSVALAGRAMKNALAAGKQVAFKLPVSDYENGELPEADVYFVTGSQGEPFSVLPLYSLCRGLLAPKPDDILIVMAEIIPGYEQNLCQMLLDAHWHVKKIYVAPANLEELRRYLTKNYAPFFEEIWQGDDEGFFPGIVNRIIPRENIHVSGHASQGDYLELFHVIREVGSLRCRVIPYHMPFSKHRSWDYFATSQLNLYRGDTIFGGGLSGGDYRLPRQEWVYFIFKYTT